MAIWIFQMAICSFPRAMLSFQMANCSFHMAISSSKGCLCYKLSLLGGVLWGPPLVWPPSLKSGTRAT